MLYRLVVHRAVNGPVHVFLPREPSAGGPPGEFVHLLELRSTAGQRLLGRHVLDQCTYREFRSEVELLLAGYEPVGAHRVCDSWAEYLNPWRSPAMNEQETERMVA